ncbi:OmpA family protein [Sorangium sp. So ce145]|uniref:OmpA family protein n=1 Tax=Sorangium sp. So ce145 TaxID=3133285 RepID=UPI003F6113B8
MIRRSPPTGKQWRAAWLLLGLAGAACSGPPPTPVYAEVSRGADQDGDGAADIDDACPAAPEDGLLPKANDGCPAPDPDHDGVLLADDGCPDAKEDGQEPEPADGCPMADADGDGVADAKDKCPSRLEDNQDPDPGDGCPSPDNDADGIADVADRCPAQAETVNGYRDSDGCPDTPPVEVAFDADASEIYVPETKKIEFETDSADLTTPVQATITEVAKVLKDHPEIGRLEIEGHASSKGGLQYNVDLTERRAQAVGRALVKAGVEPTRLVPVGYGELCPAMDRGDDVDEPKNRRVLLKAVLVRGVWQTVPRGCWRAQTAGINPTKRKPGVAVVGSAPVPGEVKPVGGA